MSIELTSLIERPEGETIDFKAIGYDISDERKKRDFAKDIASLANTPREEDAYIVLGVKKRPDGSSDIIGIEDNIDDANLQSIASKFLEPSPRFLYEAVPHGNMVLGLITIPMDQPSPAVPKETVDTGFTKGSIYFRRGSKNDLAASLQEQGRIWAWFNNRSVTEVSQNPYALEPAWNRYLTETDELRATARHILIVDARLRGGCNWPVRDWGQGPWAFVFDFDTQSDVDGLLASTRDTVESHRALHIRVKGDTHTNRSPDFTTTWFFVCGIQGRVDSIPTGGIRGWRRAYRQPLSDECNRLAGELTPATVHVTILWR